MNPDEERRLVTLMETVTAPSEVLQDEPPQARADRRAFSNPAERAMHLRLFFAWLPKLLHDEPGIE